MKNLLLIAAIALSCTFVQREEREHHYEDFSAMFPAEVTVEPSTSEKRLTTYVSVLRPGEFLQIAVYRGNKVFTDEEITDGIIYEYQRAKV